MRPDSPHLPPRRLEPCVNETGKHLPAHHGTDCGGCLYQSLHIAQALTSYLNAANLGQRNFSFTIYNSAQSLRNTAPQVNAQTITRADNVIWTGGYIHRQLLKISRAVSEHVDTKPLENRRTLRIL